MIIREANEEDIPTIKQLAHEIWWPTYQPFLGNGQISFMLSAMYSEDALKEQMHSNIVFLLVERDNKAVGFAGFSLEYPDDKICKIHKIYILLSEQGKGTGKALMKDIIALCEANGGKMLELNVNRNNPAIGFYKRLGFEIIKQVDTPYYEYTLNDYVLGLPLA